MKKLAFLAEKSAKVLYPPPPAFRGTLAILCKHIFRQIYVFENCKLRHGKWHTKKIPTSNLKKSIYNGNWQLEKTVFERYQNNTSIEWVTLLKRNNFYTVFHFKKSRFCFPGFLSGRRTPILADFSAKNASFFIDILTKNLFWMI